VPLSAGDRLGPYEILAPLGAGGMGEVYRARDARLNRDVAIKGLPAGLSRDPERLARFRREAQLLASLNHPNIAAIYGLEDAGGAPFLVLELVDGQDLSERMRRGPIPLDEAIGIARQIALALEEAHEKGIVHRDLKPQNVKLTPAGKVKVLDFGLAKAYSGDSETAGSLDSANSPTMTHAATSAGMILGTAGYMSPEQARGKSVDKRADVWAFGVVLYEMLCGRRLFEGESASDTVAAVLRDQIDLAKLPAATPESVRRLIARCLDRDVKTRLQSIGEARVALEEVAERPGATRAPARGRALRLAIMGTLVVAVLAAAIVFWLRGRGGPELKAAAPPAARSMAVLPFVNSSANADDEYLADGMTDELIAGLAKVPGLRVAARSSAFVFKGQKVEAREAAKKLGVDSVLEGTVRRSGKKLRVTASLVNASDGLQLWSDSFESEGGDAFAVQDEVTRGVVAGLALQLGGTALGASQAGRTKDPIAHDLYLRGLAFANVGSEADLRRAIEYYEKALEHDPSFALPYVGIAWAHVYLADAYVAPIEAYPKAKAAALAAIERDDRVADAHALLAYVTWALDWMTPAADKEFARALELDPNSVNALSLRGGHWCFTNRKDDALLDIDRAAALDPLSPIFPMMRELCEYASGRYAEVIEAHRATAAIDPSFVYGESWAGAAYRELGDYPSALREYALAAKSLGDAPQYGLALTYLRMGRRDDAQNIMHAMDELAKTRYVPYFMRATVHAALGDMDTAVTLLRDAVGHQEGIFLATHSLPEMAPLARDPRVRDLFEKAAAATRGR
jgi:eukaryotic-like serine/threonine-protein kinase